MLPLAPGRCWEGLEFHVAVCLWQRVAGPLCLGFSERPSKQDPDSSSPLTPSRKKLPPGKYDIAFHFFTLLFVKTNHFSLHFL